MPASSSSSALIVYEHMLAHHLRTAAELRSIDERDVEAGTEWLGGPAQTLLEEATRGERVARKMIEAWHRDRTTDAQWRREIEQAVRARFDRRTERP